MTDQMLIRWQESEGEFIHFQIPSRKRKWHSSGFQVAFSCLSPAFLLPFSILIF